MSTDLAGLIPGHTDTRTDLLDGIRWAITNHPRTLQTRIGPSEVGIECDCRLAHKLAGTPERKRDAAWRPTVGTGVHTWLASAFEDVNTHLGRDRYLIEQRVDCGDINGVPLTGSCDLYDTDTGTVIDWKIVGLKSLKDKKANGPGHQYRTQAHLYGRGLQRAGHQVTTVAIFALPSAGELTEAVWWSEPYNEALALHALARIQAIDTVVRGLGAAAPTLMNTHDSYCTWCPYYAIGATTTDPHACPGHTGREQRVDNITTLIAPTNPANKEHTTP